MSEEKQTSSKPSKISLKRRDFLKTGAAIASAPFLAGMGNSALPSETQAATNKTTCKKILAISTSPRENSNSDALCDEFMRGARQPTLNRKSAGYEFVVRMISLN